MSEPVRDCNTCKKHVQGVHPSERVVYSYGALGGSMTCTDCLDGDGKYRWAAPLPFWEPKGDDAQQPAVSATAAVKHDSGKVGVHLLPTRPLEEIAKVLDFGAKKYAAHNWRAGMKWSRLFGALLRHVYAWMRGEDNDPESGLSHLAHAGCCVLFLLQYVIDAQRAPTDNDDRYKETQ